MSEREKTYVEDVNRSIYDIRNEEKDVYRIKKGLTPDIVAEISEKKKDPAWMANFRLQSLQIYNEMEVLSNVPHLFRRGAILKANTLRSFNHFPISRNE